VIYVVVLDAFLVWFSRRLAFCQLLVSWVVQYIISNGGRKVMPFIKEKEIQGFV